MSPRIPVALALVAVFTFGCKSDQGISELKFENIAVATGDFDYVEEALARNGVGYTPYEGFISHAVYDDEVEPEQIALKSETLFTGTNDADQPELFNFDAVMINSGTRGLGAYVYNGVDEDDAVVGNATALDHVERYMARGGTIVASDWSYDLIEELWPDRVTFAYEDDGLDAAQVGSSEEGLAEVTDDELADALGEDVVELSYDFSYWTVIEEVADDVDVYLRGDLTYRLDDGGGYGTLEDVPLLIGFGAGGGRVYFSTFHWRAQKNPVTDALLFGVVEGLDPDIQAEADQESDGG